MIHRRDTYAPDCDASDLGDATESEELLEAPSDDSDSSIAATRRKGVSKAGRSRSGPRVRTLNRWTQEEHERLAALVSRWGSEKNWAKVAEDMPGRTGKQCRERWLNHMKPGIIKGNWSLEEEFLLAQCHAVVGSHWSKMTKRLPGRTENSIKNFWNATLRSKAPHKKRGILWLYMQSQTSPDGENVDAFVTAVNKLHESRELPSYWSKLIADGDLDERTLRFILRSEREFLESHDAELHGLAMPHPVHGLRAPAQAPRQAPQQQQQQQPRRGGSGGRQRDAGSRRRAAAAAEAAGHSSTAVASSSLSLAAAAAAGVAAALGYSMSGTPPSPMVPPGMPAPDQARMPAHAGGAGHYLSGGGGGARLGVALPQDMLGALPPCELWQSLPSTHGGGRCGPFNGVTTGMDTMLGLHSDLAAGGSAAGVGGAFGGARAQPGGGSCSILTPSAGGDQLWASLPQSMRGLASVQQPCAGGAPGSDVLRALQPYGALAGFGAGAGAGAAPHHLQHPGERQVALDGRASTGSEAHSADAHGLQPLAPLSINSGWQQQQPQSQQPQQQQPQLHPGLAVSSPAPAGRTSLPGDLLSRALAAFSDVMAAVRPGGAGGDQQQQQQQQQQQHGAAWGGGQQPQQLQRYSASPPGSEAVSDLSFAMQAGGGHAPRHAPGCRCQACGTLRGAQHQSSPVSGQASHLSTMGHWDGGGAPYQQQQQRLQQVQQGMVHANSDGCLTTHAGDGQQQRAPGQQHSLLSVGSAPAHQLHRLAAAQHKQAHGTAPGSPFAQHATTGWDGGGGPAAAAANSAGLAGPRGTSPAVGAAPPWFGGQQLQAGGSDGAPGAQGGHHVPQGLRVGGSAGDDDDDDDDDGEQDGALMAALADMLQKAAAQEGMSTVDYCAMVNATQGGPAPLQGQQHSQPCQAPQSTAPAGGLAAGPSHGAGSAGRNGSAPSPALPPPLSIAACGAPDSFAELPHVLPHGLAEALASARASAQLGEVLFSPLGAALVGGSAAAGAAGAGGGGAAAPGALQQGMLGAHNSTAAAPGGGTVLGLRRRLSSLGCGAEGELLLDGPAAKLQRCSSPAGAAAVAGGHAGFQHC